MAESVDLPRRRFLKLTASAAGGLLIGFHVAADRGRAEAAETAPAGDFTPNAWIRIAPDGAVTLSVASSEMGQGVLTAIPMLLAEELDADWSKVRAETAPVDAVYANPIIGQQLTGGSTAVRGFWTPLREAGAVVRTMLVSAAAQAWGVDESSCRTEPGSVVHEPSGRRLPYGELAAAAAALPVPATAFLKEPEEFRYLGRPMPRLDTPAKIDGRAVFGMDVRRPGMKIALVAHCPVFGGRLRRFDAARAKRVRGIREVFAIPAGVAVVGDDFWSAKTGRDALTIEWDEGPNAGLDDEVIGKRLVAALERPGKIARQDGDVDGALSNGGKRLEAVYEVPFLAHACMEPVNCTAEVRRDACTLWVPTQAQTATQKTAMEITGLRPEQIRVHTTFLGGGFGRRSEQDFVAEAVEISKRAGVPIKLMWTREDDTRHDFYRPATRNRLTAVLGKRGRPLAWQHEIAGPSILARRRPEAVKDGLDNTSLEGAANLPYAIPNLRVSYSMVDLGVPVGFWRSVGSSQNAYVTECFLDELAAAANRDPLDLRRDLLAEHPRHLRVLELAADRAGWDKPPPSGRHRGLAVAESFGSVVAQVAEISLESTEVRVHRVTCAVDCGIVVNPDTVEAQMQSGIVFGLTAALMGEITLKQGRVQQGNFDDYPLLRMDRMPEVEVHIVPSEEAPGGVGEPGTPPIAPAVANAVFAATGRPVRRLPIRVQGAA